MEKVSISIVVPVYNVESYLEQFLDSVFNQTFKDFEVILINDGSTDNSEKIILEYIKKYGKIKYVYQINSGQSEARNNALKYLNGKYTLYLDPDDFIEKNMLLKMFNLAEINRADIVICGYKKVYEYKEDSKVKLYDVNEDTIYSGAEVLKMVMNFKMEGYLWNKMFLTKNLFEKNIYFEKGRIVEDMYPACEQISCAKKIVFINKALYNYRQRLTSTLHEMKKIKTLEDHDYAYRNVCKLIKAHEQIDINEYYEFVANVELGHIKECKKIGIKCNKEIYKKYTIEELTLKEIMFNLNVPIKIKIKLLLFYTRTLHMFL